MLALRRGDASRALEIANEIARAQDVPAGYAIQADLIAVEALLVSGRQQEAEDLLGTLASRLQASGDQRHRGGSSFGCAAASTRQPGALTEAYHDFGQSVSVFDLLGERYQAGLSYLELGRLAGAAGARSRATRYLTDAISVFESLGADARPG